MNHIESKVLTAIIGVLGSFSVVFMKDISLNMKELNIKVTQALERYISLEQRVTRLEITTVTKSKEN